MAVTIKLKNASGSDPSSSDLVVGEVALRTDSGKLFTKKDDGSVTQIGGGSGAIDDGAITNAKVASDAAIQGTKISPDFGSQNITTTGHIDLPDSSAIKLGTGDDLQILHNGSDSLVRDLGTGGLYMTGSVVGIRNSAANEDGLLFTENAAVQLFFDNSKKFETTSAGVSVTGTCTLSSHLLLGDGDEIKLGASEDLLIFHDGANSYLQNTTGNLILKNASTDFIIFKNSDASTEVVGNLDVGAGIDCTGDLNVTGVIYLADQIRIGDDVFIEDYNAANSFRVKGNQDNNKGFIAFGSQTKQLGCNGASAALTYDGNEVLTSASTVNAATLDSLDSSQFLRSDASDTMVGNFNLTGNFSLTAELNFLSASDTSRYLDAQVGTADGTHAFQIRAVTGGDSGHEVMAQFFGGAGVKLFHNGGLAKFETKSYGAFINGHLQMDDNNIIKLGNSNDLQIYHDASDSIINDNGTGDLKLQVGGSTKLKVTSAGIHVQGSQEPQIIIQDSDSGNTGNAAETGISFKDGGGTQQGIMGFSNSGDQDFYFDTASTSGEMNFRVGGSTTQFKVTNSGIGITGNITVSGTVDGRDVASDGSKLDGIAAGATNVTNNNQLTNGAGYSTFSGSYNDLSNKPTIPTNNNQLSNGAGYITSVSGQNYNSLSNLPTIPSNNNQLSNGAGYITSVSGQNYNLLSNRPTIPTNNNQLSNGAGYITSGSSRACQAWVNFAGDGTPSKRDDLNVSSIGDNGQGNYTVSFASSMPNSNYCVVVGFANSGNSNVAKVVEGSLSTGSFQLVCGSFQDGSGNNDRDFHSVFCAIFSD
tara:strand:- start:2221 stop:4662 length:2442 start_codon:yes stop_codon:yes gene_type:complete